MGMFVEVLVDRLLIFYGGFRRRIIISGGFSRSFLGVLVEELLMVGVLEGVLIVLVSRFIIGVYCRFENV